MWNDLSEYSPCNGCSLGHEIRCQIQSVVDRSNQTFISVVLGEKYDVNFQFDTGALTAGQYFSLFWPRENKVVLQKPKVPVAVLEAVLKTIRGFVQVSSEIAKFNAQHWPHLVLVLELVRYSHEESRLRTRWSVCHLSGEIQPLGQRTGRSLRCFSNHTLVSRANAAVIDAEYGMSLPGGGTFKFEKDDEGRIFVIDGSDLWSTDANCIEYVQVAENEWELK